MLRKHRCAPTSQTIACLQPSIEHKHAALTPAPSVLSTSISTLLRAAFGDFNYNDVVSANRVLGPLFFFMWLLYAAVILLNMAIAIISESFVKVTGGIACICSCLWVHLFVCARVHAKSQCRIVASTRANALLQIIEQDEETTGETTIFDYMQGSLPQIQKSSKPQHSPLFSPFCDSSAPPPSPPHAQRSPFLKPSNRCSPRNKRRKTS